ncbi:dual specificity protein phosphatase 10-like [Clytia hemisphaerica]|uniref:protein-tyrosine-phosphatase n=1 Tax=Clytia hemisphaerica TaxID=252671 RepID=A0A7M5X7H9_9CNID|eukprot:TCONS_00017306-protein
MSTALTMMPCGNIFANGGNKGYKCTAVNSILPCDLAQEIEKRSFVMDNTCNTQSFIRTSSEPFMILDCRSFLAYNFKHISGAINVNCTNNLMKKRLQQGKITLVDLVNSEYEKECLRTGSWAKAVVYDDCTSELEKMPASHPVKLVLSSLLHDGKEAFLLKGGLKEFSQCYKNLLSDHAVAEDNNENVSSAIERINTLTKIQKDISERPNPGCPLNVRATEVIPGVFLGNASDAMDYNFLNKNNITYVLNLTCQCPNHFIQDSRFHYKQIKIEDSCRENIADILADALQFIESARENRSSVLVHCQGGVSRSPTVVISFLMHLKKLSLTEAYQFVKEKRPCIAPNLNFMGQLLQLEMKNRGLEPKCFDKEEVLKTIGGCCKLDLGN